MSAPFDFSLSIQHWKTCWFRVQLPSAPGQDWVERIPAPLAAANNNDRVASPWRQAVTSRTAFHGGNLVISEDNYKLVSWNLLRRWRTDTPFFRIPWELAKEMNPLKTTWILLLRPNPEVQRPGGVIKCSSPHSLYVSLKLLRTSKFL